MIFAFEKNILIKLIILANHDRFDVTIWRLPSKQISKRPSNTFWFNNTIIKKWIKKQNEKVANITPSPFLSLTLLAGVFLKKEFFTTTWQAVRKRRKL